MEIWLETSSLNAVQKAQQLGVLHGITTNPSILARCGIAAEELLEQLMKAQTGPVTVQVIATKAAEMIQQGLALSQFSDRIIVKIPVTREGLQAIFQLSQKKIPVMATTVFDPNQALLAARAGANYVMPYFSQICDADQDGINELKTMVNLMRHYGYASKILAATLRSTEHVRECCLLGIDAVALSETLFDEYVCDHPLTIKELKIFDRDWKKAPKSNLIR